MEQEINPEKLIKQETIERLQRLKTGYRDGVPNEMKDSTSPDSGWKVQKGVWFQAVANELVVIAQKYLEGTGIISEELGTKLVKYVNRLTAQDNNLFKKEVLKKLISTKQKL